MSKKEVAAIEWLDMETLKRLLATTPDDKTTTKPGASRNRRGRARQNARPSRATEQGHAAKVKS
jgi:hypothetical protein